MHWPWTPHAEAARLAGERKARFIQLAREAHEGARQRLGPQKLKPRDWEPGPCEDRRHLRAQRRGATQRPN